MAKAKTTGRRDNRTGAIYKDGDGYRVQVLLRYDTKDGKPVYLKRRAKTHDLAVEALAKLQHAARLKPLAAPSSLTLAGCIERWLEDKIKPTRAPKTYAQYNWVLNQHVIPTLGKKRLDHVTRPDVQSLVRALSVQKVQSRSKPKDPKKEGDDNKETSERKELRILGRRTIAVAVRVLHAVYQDAIRDGLASSNPVDHVELPAESRKTPQFLTPEEVVTLTENLGKSPIRELVLFMLATGARLGEARGIRWQDIDFPNRIVRICGQLQRIAGNLEYRPTTKTNQDREIALPQWMAEELQVLSSRRLVEESTDPDRIVFLNAAGRRLDEKYVYNELHKACAKAKVPLVSPHKLRHTAATLALMDSDLHAVQKMLGHQQVGLTSNLYGHLTQEKSRKTADALGNRIRPTPKDGTAE